MLTIRLDSPLPLAEQVRTGIRQAIAAGELRPGDPLPTVRQLAFDLGINLNTVARAYRRLETEGLVSTRRGRGTVVEAAREVHRESEESVAERIAAEVRNVLANARLSGLTREQLEVLVGQEAGEIWSEEGETS